MRSSRRQFGQIMLWSGLSNLALVGCFVLASNWTQATALARSLYDNPRPQPVSTNVARTTDPLAAARMFRTDNEVHVKGVQSSLKVSLSLTRIPPSRAVPTQWNDEANQANTGYEGEPTGGPETPVNAVAYDTVPTVEETQGLHVAPTLHKDRKTGQLEIGNFKSLTFVGNSTECLDMGYSMLGDVGTSNDLLQVLTSSDAITIAKICAQNGSVVISCRNNQITVSPRQSRPDDKCSRAG